MDGDDSMKGWHLHAEIAHVDSHIEFVSIASVEDHIVWVVEVDNVKGHVFILALCWYPKDTSKEILPKASIFLPPKPTSGESEG
jgi:hypothetical protein